jgi:regulatory protein
MGACAWTQAPIPFRVKSMLNRKRPEKPQPREKTPPRLVGGTITRITPQRDPARISLYIDGQFALGVGTQIAEERGLRVGLTLSAPEIAALRDADELGKAVEKALAFLTSRPRSIREVRDRLKEKEVPPDTIEAVMQRLEGWGYIGDEGFARYWIENRTANQPRGKRLLRQELWRKGVERETVDQILDDVEINEDGAALELARKRLRQLRALDEQTQRRRLAAFLQRRGYDWPTVKRALDHLFSSREGSDDDGEALGDSDSYAYEG